MPDLGRLCTLMLLVLQEGGEPISQPIVLLLIGGVIELAGELVRWPAFRSYSRLFFSDIREYGNPVAIIIHIALLALRWLLSAY
jgi:hypothetical protein